MQKVLSLALGMALMLVGSTAALAAPVNVGGEVNFGYDYSVKDYEEEKGAAVANWTVKLSSEVNPNLYFYGELKSTDLNGAKTESGDIVNGFFCDEVWAQLTFKPMNLAVGYFTFAFGGSKDILNLPMADFNSVMAIQAEIFLAKAGTLKIYYPTRANTWDQAQVPDKVSADNAFALAMDFKQPKYGMGWRYGRTDKARNGKTGAIGENAYTYTVTGYVNPIEDLRLFVDYSYYEASDPISDSAKAKVIGMLYSSKRIPVDCRMEYDLESIENGDFKLNPWGVRLGYQLNPNTRLEVNRARKGEDDTESSLKFKIYF